MPKWITTDEAAKITEYSVENIRKLAATGKIKAQRWGRDWQIDAASVIAYARKIAKSGAKRGPKVDR